MRTAALLIRPYECSSSFSMIRECRKKRTGEEK